MSVLMVRCPLCGEESPMPSDGPVPLDDVGAPDWKRIVPIAEGYQRILERECKYVRTLSHSGWHFIGEPPPVT